MGDDGVDETRQEKGVAEVGVERRALRDGPRHNRGSRRGKRPLEEEDMESLRRVRQRPVAVTQEVVAHGAVGKSVAENVYEG